MVAILNLAGLAVRVTSRTRETARVVESYCAYAFAQATAPDLEVELGADAPHDEPDLLLEREGAWLTTRGTTVRIGGTTAVGYMERLWMHAMAYFLAPRGGLVVHAAAVEGPAGAVAFLGPSGAGKTTAARNCPGRLLNPDRVAIGVREGTAWLAPLPFMYPDLPNGSALPIPLARLAFVEKAERNSACDVAPADRSGRFLASTLMPPDPRGAAGILATVEELGRVVPTVVLRARLSGGFWHLLTDQKEPVAPGGRSD